MAALADTSAGCNNHDLTQYLAERGLMAYGQTGDLDALTDRNSDRVRILKHLANHPEGIKLTVLVHHVLKGSRPDNYYGFHDLSGDSYERLDNWSDTFYKPGGGYVRLDGSDDDYQFARRFVDDLAVDGLARLEDVDDGEAGGRWVYPTTSTLDLISAGITETPQESDDLVYDREFCANMLRATRSRLLSLSESQKDHLANSLRRYIQRVEDYRLAFDVHLADRNGYQKRRMTKPYATRFTDPGRVDRTFAMLQDSLEWGAEHADTAVFCTLTTDPKKFDSLWGAIQAINENFHALTQWMKSDPDTVADTRNEGVSSWKPVLDSSNFHFGAEGAVSGRPRKKLQYLKVLEWTNKGYPHLHVLFFDPPRRETDGMPWLCDKDELSYQWNRDTESRPGQGAIVDTWPLVYRDDLDRCGDFGTEVIDGEQEPVSEGFVSWYRYGDHDHDQEWVEARSKAHDQIDFDGDDDSMREKTAGAYIGKYLSETYAKLSQTESLDDPEFEAAVDADKSSWWKLALYWCTERRFWSVSRQLRRDIELDADRTEIRRGVAEATRTSICHRASLEDDHALYPDFDWDSAESYLHPVVRDVVNSQDLEAQDAGQSQTTLANVEYLGAYHWADMPASPDRPVDPNIVEEAVYGDDSQDIVLASTGDRPPPITEAF